MLVTVISKLTILAITFADSSTYLTYIIVVKHLKFIIFGSLKIILLYYNDDSNRVLFN